MRIRRYAARLLASSASTAPSSLPPPPTAAWCHAAADDCAICELSRSAPQATPDAIKQKGHIAGRVPGAELSGDAHVGLAQRPPVREDQGCNVDDGPAVKKAFTGLEATRRACGFSDAAARLEGSGKASLVTGAATEQAVRRGASMANGAVCGQEDKGTICSLDESVSELVATGVASLVNGATAVPEVSRTASLANITDTEPTVSDRVPLMCEAATEQGAEISVPEVTEGALPDCEGAATRGRGFSHVIESAVEMEVTKGISLVNETAADRELAERVSLGNGLFTEPGDKDSVSEVTERASFVSEGMTEPGITFSGMDIIGSASLGNEATVEPEVTGIISLVNKTTEQEVKEGACIFTRVVAQLEVNGRASACSGDGDVALDEPRPPDCDLEVANVQVGNAGEAVASKLHPCIASVAGAGGSINSTSNARVRDKSQAAEEVAPPSVSCLSDIVARSIGKSGRTDIICYARRQGKRKLKMVEIKEENVEMDDSDIYDQYDEKLVSEKTGPCESVTSTAVSVEIKIADIKRELEDNSSASKGKKKKGQRFECEIDYCHMTFKTRAELSVHRKNTCTVKSCGRRFRSHTYLRHHQSIHNDAMPYKCPWEGCGMAFKWSWDRGEHFQVHTGKRPYKCTTPGCSKMYKFVSDFTRHRRRCKPQR